MHQTWRGSHHTEETRHQRSPTHRQRGTLVPGTIFPEKGLPGLTLSSHATPRFRRKLPDSKDLTSVATSDLGRNRKAAGRRMPEGIAGEAAVGCCLSLALEVYDRAHSWLRRRRRKRPKLMRCLFCGGLYRLPPENRRG
jgi:hypothetical protein